jgi:ribonuclease Z
MANHHFVKHTLDTLEIEGYSVGGEETVVTVPSLDVCFDVGRAPDEMLPINNMLLSHGHMDHAAGVAYYCSQRNFREMAEPTLLVPSNLVGPIDQLLNCWGAIDGNRPPAKIVAMEAGQEYELRRNLFAFAFATNHFKGSLGYTIIERRQKLKEEYLELPGPEIALLRKGGTQITYTLNMPMVTYLGDTMGGEFENLACVTHSKILIAECTFFDPEHHQRARAGKHYHIEQLSELLEQWHNEHIILTHLSRRTDIKQARKSIEKMCSPELAGRIRFLMERPARR